MIISMDRLRTVTAVAAVFLLAACTAVPQKESHSVPFDANAVAFANHTGASKISGQAFYTRDRDGENSVSDTTYTCAGRKVRLIPFSAYTKAETDEWVKKIRWTDPRPIGTAPYRERTAICDAQGNFTFESLPAGKWIVFAEIPFRSGKGLKIAGASVNFREFAETNGKNSVHVVLGEASR